MEISNQLRFEERARVRDEIQREHPDWPEPWEHWEIPLRMSEPEDREVWLKARRHFLGF